MCQALEVSRSGYYAWQQRGQTTQREQEDVALTAQIRQIFEDSHQTYGSPRIQAELRARGIVCSRHRVARLMRQAGVNVGTPHRRVQTT
jgi:putative transposase